MRLRGLGGPTPGASDAINAAALKYGIPPSLLLAVAQQESGLNQGAVSSAGAIGVMQLMPGTAAQLGVNPYDLNSNIDGGARYLSSLINQFGDYSLALAAYNAGPGNVQKYGGIPPFPETQNYVTSVLYAAGLPGGSETIDASGGTTCDPTVDPTCSASMPSPDNSGLFAMVIAAAIGIFLMVKG